MTSRLVTAPVLKTGERDSLGGSTPSHSAYTSGLGRNKPSHVLPRLLPHIPLGNQMKVGMHGVEAVFDVVRWRLVGTTDLWKDLKLAGIAGLRTWVQLPATPPCRGQWTHCSGCNLQRRPNTGLGGKALIKTQHGDVCRRNRATGMGPGDPSLIHCALPGGYCGKRVNRAHTGRKPDTRPLHGETPRSDQPGVVGWSPSQSLSLEVYNVRH